MQHPHHEEAQLPMLGFGIDWKRLVKLWHC
jgi:hypothetical protein